MSQSANDVEFVEEQFILRLPLADADKVRNALHKRKTRKYKKLLKLEMDDGRNAIVTVGKRKLHGQLVDLPCIVESQKTISKKTLFKTADISQMLICRDEPFPAQDGGAASPSSSSIDSVQQLAYPHGITPPMKNVRKRRFRKLVRNENPDEIDEIKKELIRLLRMDSDAESTTFELINEQGEIVDITDEYIFGGNVSDVSND